MKNVSAFSSDTSDKPLSLRPHIHSTVLEFLQDEELIFNLVNAFGSPLNLIFPTLIDDNIKSFQDIYKKHVLQGAIYFTTKPNKSNSVVKQAALQNVGIDVSSEEALKIALGCGFHPNRIECTGPKNLVYLALAIQQNTIINADNFEELKQIVALKNSLGIEDKVKVFIRLSGFSSARLKFTAQDGTFGIHINDASEIFSFLLAEKQNLDFQGFSFHFNAQSSEQKVIAIENTLKLTLEAHKKGLSPKGVNIGGGFDICYAAEKQDWLDYLDTLKNSLRHNRQSLNWNDSGLGFRNEGGLIKGAPNFMAHHVEQAGAKDLDAYLNSQLAGFDHMTTAQILTDCLLALYIEPGRALLDQLGLTIGRVSFTKKSTHGEMLVGLDMNRNNIHATQQKLLTDPIILYRNKTDYKPCSNGLYYMGNLCLSYDMITYNKTFPEYLPEVGDLVIFINTAPYIMDFVESSTLHQKIADKVAIVKNNNKFFWFKDDVYNPVVHDVRRSIRA